MADTVSLTIADVTFAGFEIPQEVPFGTDQMISLHKMIGGARIIDAMGADPRPITWSGRFRGSTAVQRAERLDTIAQQGLPVQLALYSMQRLVVVTKFTWRFMQFYEVPYEITVEVLQNKDAAVLTAPASVQSDIDSDLASIDDLVPQINFLALTIAIDAIDAIATQYGSLALAPSSIALTGVANAQAASAVAFETQQLAIESGLALPRPPTGLSTNYLISDLIAEVQALLGRMAINLQGTGTTSQQVNGGNLFSWALAKYSKAENWNILLQGNWFSMRGSNGLIDYLIPGQQALTIQQLTANSETGGVVVPP
jgi:hypothetical protein